MKLAFVYNIDDVGMSGTHWTNNAYRFFIKGLTRFAGIEHETFAVRQEVDCKRFAGFDAVIFYSLENLCPIGLDKLNAIKVVRAPDPHAITLEWVQTVGRGKVDLIINHHTPEYMYSYLPTCLNYEQIIFGITKELHTNPPFDKRLNAIVQAGEIGRDQFYRLRKKCCALQGVEHVTKSFGYTGDRYPALLSQYKAGIAACTVSSVYKYFEVPACGCLSFMEVNERNGCDNLGSVDGKSAVFISESNYKSKIAEYVADPDNPRWRAIARKGRQVVMTQYENEAQIAKLLRAIEEVAV